MDQAIENSRDASPWPQSLFALAASLFGFIASWLYVVRARASADPWAMKMALHMAGWHLLLTLLLFPTALWGGRVASHAVRAVSWLFFLIHAAIALSNAVSPAAESQGTWIALLNAASGLAFLATAVGARSVRTAPCSVGPRDDVQSHD
jgi:hypothetical protein